MARIPQHFIEDLVGRVDIVELIDARVPLKKAGQNYKACCPFHGEKTPSFTVSQTKQFYHCFGCGMHGTALSFLMEYDRLEFLDAVRELAHQVGVEIPVEQGQSEQRDTTRPLYDVLERASDYFQQQLRAAPQAIEYLKNRGISGRTAKQFGIGYAPAGWDNALNAVQADQAQMLTVGLATRNDNGRVYDKFRDRIQFPIRDTRGRVIGFGGRVLGDGEPKYLNSPETPVFHKGRELYGLFEARKASRELPHILIVEGYMDVVALAEHGIHYAVATLGTATTPEHLPKLYRATETLIFCFDGDRAGRDAAWRALENTLPEMKDGRAARFLFLPDGEDPDSLVQHEGKAAFEQRLKQAQPLSRFLLDSLTAQTDLSSMDGRARLVSLAQPHVAKVPLGPFRELLLDELARLAQFDRERLGDSIENPALLQQATPRRATKPAPPGRVTPIRQAIAILLEQPQLALQIDNPEELAALDLPGATLFGNMLKLVQQHPQLQPAGMLEHWRDAPEYAHLAKLAQQEFPQGADLPTEFMDSVNKLRMLAIDQQIDQLKSQPLHALSAEDKRRLSALLQQAAVR